MSNLPPANQPLKGNSPVRGDSPPPSAGIEVISIKPASGGSVMAYVAVRIGGVVVHGAKVVQQTSQKGWVAMPDTKWTDAAGKVRYSPIVELSPALKEKVTTVVLEAWEAGR